MVEAMGGASVERGRPMRAIKVAKASAIAVLRSTCTEREQEVARLILM